MSTMYYSLESYEIEQRQLNFSSPKRLWNQGTLNGSSEVKVTDNAFSYKQCDVREPLMLILEEKLFCRFILISYITKL